MGHRFLDVLFLDFRGGLETQDGISDPEFIAGRQERLLLPHAAHDGSISALKILQAPSFGGEEEAGMVAGYGGRIQDEVVVGLPPDEQNLLVQGASEVLPANHHQSHRPRRQRFRLHVFDYATSYNPGCPPVTLAR